jgi:hypothetical protein
MTEHFPTDMLIADLQLADTVKLFDGPFGYAVVEQIADGIVTLFRPYAQTLDFSHTGGVICLTGIEKCTYLIQSARKLTVYSRKALK